MFKKFTYKKLLLEDSIELRKLVNYYTNEARNLKNELNINSSEEYTSEENSSGDNWSGDSSDEESRPSKRPRN